MKEIADTGLIVALLTRNDRYHAWAGEAFRSYGPFFTCDAVLVEAASFFPNPHSVLQLVMRGDLVLDPSFLLTTEMVKIFELIAKYADCPMDLAGACLVRMSELSPHSRIWTVDRSDFTTYRRNRRQLVPCQFSQL